MSRMVRARYTLEYKLEAVRLVRGGQPIGTVARGLGISDQTVHKWVKAEAKRRLAATGNLGRASNKPPDWNGKGKSCHEPAAFPATAHVAIWTSCLSGHGKGGC